MKIFRSDEEAVSPVIGVILMVAIVVILAAVIAAFVFGMAGSTSSTKTVGMVVTPVSTGYQILWQGGSDINSITALKQSIDGATSTAVVATAGTLTYPPGVGETWNLTYTGGIAEHHLVLIGTFTDGSDQVIFDRRF